MYLNETLFWTERDDLENDETSSRDPLGTETFAGQLAELILPGLTTITWRIRYLTIICLWLKFIREELQEDNTDEILEHIKNLEKLTAYCIVKRCSENEDDNQTDNLKESEKIRLRHGLLANDMRKTTFMLIKKNIQEREFDTISKISKVNYVNEFEKRVIDICDYITRFERLNREVHYIFYSLMNIDANQIDIRDFLRKSNIQDSLNTMTGKTLDDYIEFHAGNEQFLGKYDKRPYELFIQLKEYRNNGEQCMKTIIEYHVKNQKQKTKAPWIDHKNGKCTVILTQYRKNPEEVERIREMAVHSYRTHNAWKMIHELAI